MISATSVRLGIVGSSGGSALATASKCLKSAGKDVEWVVVTDRKCGLEIWAEASGHIVHRVDYLNADSFSNKACQIFRDEGCHDVLLFFTRRVASPLIDQLNVCNIHPALLPAFRGLHGVKDAIASGVKVLGATLHRVDAGLDTGPIIAQVVAPLKKQLLLSEAEHLSYLQKIWLTLAWFDYLTNPYQQPEMGCCGPAVILASPGIADESLRISYSEIIVGEEQSHALIV